MKGLILKDLYLLKQQAKFLIFVLGIFVVSQFFSGSVSYILSFSSVYIPTYLLTLFSFDRQSQWEGYASTLPVSGKTRVGSRYALILLVQLICFSILAVVGVFWNKEIPTEFVLFQTVTLFFVSSLFLGLSVPLSYKLGPEKARMSIFLSYFILFAIVMVLNKNSIRSIQSILESLQALKNPNLLSLPIIAFALLLFGLSYLISVKIVEGKEY